MINQELLANYGALEINTLPRKDYHNENSENIDWLQLIIESKKSEIVCERIRFLTDRGFLYVDLSYFHVRINGVRYNVTNSPFSQMKRNGLKSELYTILNNEKIWIKDFFNKISIMY